MNWFISRHSGAIQWIKRTNIDIDRFEQHLDTAQVNSGDVVYGTLPVHLAYEVCQRNARYIHLTLDVPLNLRGRELNSEQLEQVCAKLQEFRITLIQA